MEWNFMKISPPKWRAGCAPDGTRADITSLHFTTSLHVFERRCCIARGYCKKFVVSVFGQRTCTYSQGRIKRGGQRGQLPRAPRCKGPPVMKFLCFKENTRWKNFCESEAIQEYNSTIIFLYVALSIRGPQQQLYSLQLWLSASFSNRYWITYKCFRFCSMQILYIWFRW